MTRKKLKKYLGKKLRYTGIVKRIQDGGMLITDIELNGKSIVDHIWTSYTKNSKCLEIDKRISFFGTAQSYKRRDGSRDYTIGKCHSWKDLSVLTIINDDKYANNRRMK